ncbi:hypothetical protein AgCh_017203 [Apium graveolens]
MKLENAFTEFIGSDVVYLDTTYRNLKFVFMVEDESIDYIVEVVNRIGVENVEKSQSVLFLVGTYVIGTGRNLVEISKRCNRKELASNEVQNFKTTDPGLRDQVPGPQDSVLQHVPEGNRYVPFAGEAVSLAQDVVKSMVSKGYVLGVGALSKAKSFGESHQVSATATTKVAKLSERIGLIEKIYAGVRAIKYVDERYHIYDTTKSAVEATVRTATVATNTVVNNSYISKGALWMSDALNRAAKAAADLSNRDGSK